MSWSPENRKVPSDRQSWRGFTFIELLLVIILIGVVAGMNLPRLKGTFDRARIQSFVGELTRVFDEQRYRAKTDAQTYVLVIEPSQQRYCVRRDTSLEPLKTYAIPRGIVVKSEELEIFFYPDGSVDKVTIEILAGSENITLTTKGVWDGAKVQPPT
jgi:prepilin-type N-terminal cleavage/methylation domain-containing protein